MGQEIKTIDDLFNRIDDELIVISEAKQKGKYQWFDFVAALRWLNDLLQNEGYNEYRRKKVAELVNVLNDLCHTVVQTHYSRILSYNEVSKTVKAECQIIGEEAQTGTVEYKITPELDDYYKGLELPEKQLRDIAKTVKIDYLIKGCEIDYGNLGQIYYPGDSPGDFWEDGWGSFCLNYFYLLNDKREDFRHIFAANLDLYNNQCTFEGYIKQLKAMRNIQNQSNGAKNDFIVKDRNKVLAFIDNELSRCSGPQGKLIAALLIVLHKNGYIVDWHRKLSQILDILRKRYGSKIGTQGNIEVYLRGYKNSKYSDKNITDDDLIDMENRLNQME